MVVPLLSALLVVLVASCCASSPEGGIPTFNFEDVSQPPVADGSVRLADGPTELEGRVEISYNGSWFAVCDYIFGIEEADVVCRQLGFDAAIASQCCSQYGYTDLPGILNQVECTGSEDNLLSCPHTEAGFGNCQKYNHVGVICRRELTPCPLPVGPTIDWDAVYQCINPYYQQFVNTNSPQVPGEVSPFLTIANLIDAVGAVWDSDSLVQGMGHLCRLVAPRLADLGPDVFRGVCDPVLTALSEGTDLDSEQICRFVYSIAMPRPYTGAPYTPDTSTPYTTSTETPRTPGGLSTDYPISFQTFAPYICVFPIEYLSFSEGPPFGVDAFRNLDIVTLLTEAVENVLNITSYDEDTVCSAVGDLTSREYAPRDIAIDFMAELLADLYPAAYEICTNWDDIVETILSESSSYFYSFDVGVMVDEIPALIALFTDFPDRETLCLSIRTATLLGEEAVYASARSMVESMLNVLTTQEKCVSLIDSTLTVITDTSDGITLGILEAYELPFYTGFDDVQDICQYLETSFGPRYPALQVRLVGGRTPNEGRVEVQYAGEWETVCDDEFDDDDAKVVCRQLGYRGEAVSLGNQRPGTGEILLDNVGCLGVESNLGQCPNAGITVHNCVHNEDVSVTCSFEVTPQPSPPSQLWTTPSSTDNGFPLTRLVGGSTENEGRLEVFYQGQWGTVCDDFWNAHNTDVACRSLGFQGGEGFSCCAEYGEGDGPIILDDVDCKGEEDSIASCGSAGPLRHDCRHLEDVGISCIPNAIPTINFEDVSQTQVADGSVRLADGPTELEGRVEIFYTGSWFAVCDEIWRIEEANVVCRQLGFEAAIAPICCSRYGYTDLRAIFNRVECTGSEDNLLSCPHTEPGYANCQSYRHAGVICRRELTPCPLPVGPTINWDAVYQCINPYYQEFVNTNSPQVPGEVSPFLTIANLIDAVGAVWDSDSLVQGMGNLCQFVAPRLADLGPDILRGVCDPVLTALSEGTDLDSEQICRFVYSITMPRPYTGAPYTPDTSTPYTPSTETPQTPGGSLTDYPISFSSIHPMICDLFSEYPLLSVGPPLGVDAFRNLDIVTLMTQAVENVLNITSYDEDTVCSAVGHLASREYAPRDIAIDFMAELLADLYPAANEICANWDDIVETILSESSSYFYSFDVGVMVEEIPALIALLTDFPDRETLCLSIRTATLLGEEAVYASAKSMVESMLNVLTTEGNCVSLIDSTLTVITDTSDEITLGDLEQYDIPFYTGFDDVQGICQYLETSFGPRYPPLQVRLVGGGTPNDGRVEVQYAGEWGTVCDDAFDNDDAKVVCRQLGYRGEAVSLGNQNPGTGEILLDDVGCLGVESNLGQCPNAGITVHNCAHSEDVSVSCSLEVTPSPPSQLWTTPSTTDIGFLLTRLVGGSTENEGRLEVFYQGQWGTVCDDRWTASASDVACRSLGFQGGEGFSCCAEYGGGTGPIVLDDVICTGEEDSIASCSHSRPLIHDCGHSEDVSISCIPNGTGTGAVRLVGGSNEAEGRVEIRYNGVWGTICDDSWDINDANVVCRMLGFQGASRAPGSAQFGQGTDPIQLDDVGCLGDEQTIFDCAHPAFGVHNCGHYEDASVVCTASAGAGTRDVRLVGGSNEAEGRVEIQYNGVWGTICDDDWDINDANVVCRMLGFQGAAGAVGLALFGQGTDPIQLDDVGCTGVEQTIFDCAHPALGVHNCGHYEDAGVLCIAS